MRLMTASFAALFMFLVGFALGGWLILPRVPATPDRRISFVETGYGIDNLPGAILGLVLAVLSYRAAMKTKDTRR